MPLVTSAEVQALVGETINMDPYILTASIIVTEDLVASAAVSYSAERLKQIELYLAAHFFTVARNHGGLVAKKIGQASEQYAEKIADSSKTGLLSTLYGQQAASLDTTGTIASLAANSGKLKAQFRVI